MQLTNVNTNSDMKNMKRFLSLLLVLCLAAGLFAGCGKEKTHDEPKDEVENIVVDGQVVNIPSYSVKPGQVIGVREKAKSLEVIENSLSGFNHAKYAWLEWDNSSMSGKYLHIPERADIPENIKEQLIVELYSK